MSSFDVLRSYRFKVTQHEGAIHIKRLPFYAGDPLRSLFFILICILAYYLINSGFSLIGYVFAFNVVLFSIVYWKKVRYFHTSPSVVLQADSISILNKKHPIEITIHDTIRFGIDAYLYENTKEKIQDDNALLDNMLIENVSVKGKKRKIIGARIACYTKNETHILFQFYDNDLGPEDIVADAKTLLTALSLKYGHYKKMD